MSSMFSDSRPFCVGARCLGTTTKDSVGVMKRKHQENTVDLFTRRFLLYEVREVVALKTRVRVT